MKERQTKRPDVKKEFQQVRKEIKETEKRLDAKIDKLDVKIDQVEKRLDDKIDIAVVSMKDYVDIKFDRMQNNFDQMQTNFNQLGGKLDTAVKGIVDIIERSIGDRAKMEDKVQNHEQRISYLETKTG